MDSSKELTILTRKIQSLLPIVAMLMPETEEKAKFTKLADEIIKIKTF
jgi:hypothetical protein